MKEEEIAEIRRLIELVIYSSTKAEARKYITRLEFLASMAKGSISSYASGKLSRAINSAKQASGCVDNKEHWASNVERELYMLEKEVNN